MIKKILLPMIFLFSLSANAGLWIEPYLGYSLNTVDFKTEVAGYDLMGAFNDVRMGGRVGYKTFGFMAGIDYNMGSGELDADIAGAPQAVIDQVPTFKANVSNLGVFVGYKLPFLLKVWGTYWLSSKYTDDATDDSISGSGYSIGVGFAPIPLPLPLIDLFVNVEYKMANFDDNEGVEIDYDIKEILLSVSVPISL